jgi:hypothetical protein
MSHSNRGHIIKEESAIPRIALIVIGLAGVVALVTLAILFAPEAVDQIRDSDKANDNRAWLTAAWTERERSADEFNAMVNILADHRIEQIYVESTRWHGETGELIELPLAASFVPRFNSINDDISILVWLRADFANILDPENRTQMADFADRVVGELGFDGVHVQVRSVRNNSEDFILLLRELDAALPPQGILSVAVPPDRTPADPSVPNSDLPDDDLTWSQEFKRRVALNVNEIALMAHASGLNGADEYERWIAYQVESYARIINELELDVDYIIALPTYPEEVGHNPAAENPVTAIRGILEGIEQSDDAGEQVAGVGLYPWDETDSFELEDYWQRWVQR